MSEVDSITCTGTPQPGAADVQRDIAVVLAGALTPASGAGWAHCCRAAFSSGLKRSVRSRLAAARRDPLPLSQHGHKC